LIIVWGTYRFRPRRIALRNDYCLACASACRAVQIRTFDALHLFYIPLVPMGFRRRWWCTTCGRLPHVHPGTRRGFKWAGLIVLIFLSVFSWLAPLTPDVVIFGWVLRIGGPTGALLTVHHLLRTPKDPSLKEKLAAIPPATDTVCPFCGSPLLVRSSQCPCAACGILRL
jgi:hypothetical protein